MERAKKLFWKATFIMNRGYDDNKMFQKMEKPGQDNVIRLTDKRKLLYHNKWTPATQLRDRRKGKIGIDLIYKGAETNALKVSTIRNADPIKEKVYFCYYRLAKGIRGILSYAKESVRLWFRAKRPAYRQLCLKLTV